MVKVLTHMGLDHKSGPGDVAANAKTIMEVLYNTTGIGHSGVASNSNSVGYNSISKSNNGNAATTGALEEIKLMLAGLHNHIVKVELNSTQNLLNQLPTLSNVNNGNSAGSRNLLHDLALSSGFSVDNSAVNLDNNPFSNVNNNIQSSLVSSVNNANAVLALHCQVVWLVVYWRAVVVVWLHIIRMSLGHFATFVTSVSAYAGLVSLIAWLKMALVLTQQVWKLLFAHVWEYNHLTVLMIGRLLMY